MTPPEPLGRPIRMPGPDPGAVAMAERNKAPGAETAAHLQAREAVEGLKRMFVAKGVRPAFHGSATDTARASAV